MDRYTHVKNKKRKQIALSKRQEQYVLTLYHPDESSNVDSNSKRFVKIFRDGVLEKHVSTVWDIWSIGK